MKYIDKKKREVKRKVKKKLHLVHSWTGWKTGDQWAAKGGGVATSQYRECRARGCKRQQFRTKKR